MPSMKNHPYYPLVTMKSFIALAQADNLDSIMHALIADPLEAEDLASTDIKLPHRVEDFADGGGSLGVAMAMNTASEWVLRAPSDIAALIGLYRWDPRVSIWCSFYVIKRCCEMWPTVELRSAGQSASEALQWSLSNKPADDLDPLFMRMTNSIRRLAVISASDLYIAGNEAMLAGSLISMSVLPGRRGFARSVDDELYDGVLSLQDLLRICQTKSSREASAMRRADPNAIVLCPLFAEACLAFSPAR